MAESLFSIYQQWLNTRPLGVMPLSFEEWKAQNERQNEARQRKNDRWDAVTRYRAEQQAAKTAADRQTDRFNPTNISAS